jgi:hypothetical protein
MPDLFASVAPVIASLSSSKATLFFPRLIGDQMKFASLAFVFFAFLLASGNVRAQFTQPPPDRAAPTCSLKKKSPAGQPITVECKDTVVSASSPSLQCGYSGDYVYCTTATWLLVNGQWVEIDNSSALHDWAYIVDGREYYWSPVYEGSIWIDCGNSRQGHVRVAVVGGVAQQAFHCPNPVPNPW